MSNNSLFLRKGLSLLLGEMGDGVRFRAPYCPVEPLARRKERNCLTDARIVPTQGALHHE